MSVNEEIIWIWLSLLGSPINNIIDMMFNWFDSTQNMWKVRTESELSSDILANKKLTARILDDELKNRAQNYYSQTIKSGVSITHLGMNNYPINLKNTYNRPAVLYYYGILPTDTNLLAVVGSRKCTAYGRTVAFKICRDLAFNGFGIVSGLARGIDTKAHEGALEGNGYTIAVLGGSPENIYPPENERLYGKIREKGCIISEYAPGMPPLKSNFPARNRIIAGIASGTLLVEAAKSSGAMITVDRTIEGGRDVFAIPGNIDSPLSEGTNELIKSGAICTTNYKDILDAFNFEYKKAEAGNPGWLLGLTGLEACIAQLILNGIHDSTIIAQESHAEIGQIQATLTILELKGIIHRRIDGFFSIS